MQRKGKKSKLLERTLGVVKDGHENPLLTSSAKRTLTLAILIQYLDEKKFRIYSRVTPRMLDILFNLIED